MSTKDLFNFQNIKLFNLCDLFSSRIQVYIDKATDFNKIDRFCFYNTKSISLLSGENIERLKQFDAYLSGLDFLEKNIGLKKLFSVVPVPYKQTKNKNIQKLSGLDIGSLGTNGKIIVDDDFPRIYSNWQLSEYEVEPYIKNEIDTGWYLFLRGTMTDFCNLNFTEQCDKFNNHSISKILSELQFIKGSQDLMFAKADECYAVGCLESLLAKNSIDIPIKNGFLRTQTLYRDGSRMGILGSAYGFDIDGFWAGEGGGANISIAICIKIQNL